MKKTLLSISAFLLSVMGLNAQDAFFTLPYSFESYHQVYSPLIDEIDTIVNPTDLTFFEYPEFEYMMPFDFKMNDQTVTAWEAYSGFWLNINDEMDMEEGLGSIFSFTTTHFYDSTSSVISSLSGLEGSRIAKIQVSNAAVLDMEVLEEDPMGDIPVIGKYSYQVWFYETSNIIEFHMGVNTIPEGFFDGFNNINITGLRSSLNTEGIFQFHFIHGDDTSFTSHYSTVNPLEELTEEELLEFAEVCNYGSSLPPQDYVFRFTPITEDDSVNNIPHLISSQLNVYPNPVNDFINVDFKNDVVKLQAVITDIKGRAVKSISLDRKNNHIDLSSLRNGMYFINFSDGINRYSRPFVKH